MMGIYYYIEDKDGKDFLDQYDICSKLDRRLYSFGRAVADLINEIPHECSGELYGQEAQDLMKRLQNELRLALEINKGELYDAEIETANKLLKIPAEEVTGIYHDG